MYDINIVIVNWVERDGIDRCLGSLYDDICGSKLKIIVHVIDNSENIDGIKEMLRKNYPQAIYYNPGGNVGFGRAQNIGFGMSEAKYYLALNPDIDFVPDSHTLERVFDFMEKNEKVGIVAPKLLNFDDTVQNSCYRFPAPFDVIGRRLGLNERYNYFKKAVDYYLMNDFEHNKNVAVDWVMGSFLMARAEMTKSVGFFDDRYFMYFEDADWCRRTWRAGWQVFYLQDVEIKHLHKRESAQENPFLAVLINPVARMHIMSWLKYFYKWGIKKEHFGY